MRDNFSGGSKKVALLHNRQTMLRREIRNMNNGTAAVINSTAINRFWLRLVRFNSQIIGYTSANGLQWTQTMVAPVSMGSCVHIGLVVYGSSPGSDVTATFSNVLIVGNSSIFNLQAPNTDNDIDLNSLDLESILFPNPAMDITYLDLSNLEGQEAEIVLLDLMGKQVMQQKIETISGSTYPLDVSALPNGVYTLILSSGNQPPQSLRLLIQH